MELILNGCQKYLDYNKTKEAYETLCYCFKYFEKNPNSEFTINYIRLHIIVDYYHNNKMFLPYVIDLINILNQLNNEKIHDLLNINKSNIEYYENKELIQ